MSIPAPDDTGDTGALATSENEPVGYYEFLLLSGLQRGLLHLVWH